jgi:hypothetical protein
MSPLTHWAFPELYSKQLQDPHPPQVQGEVHQVDPMLCLQANSSRFQKKEILQNMSSYYEESKSEVCLRPWKLLGENPLPLLLSGKHWPGTLQK